MRMRYLTMGVIAVTLLGSCGDGQTGPKVPVPGALTFELQTPNAQEGALLIQLSGPGLTAAAVSTTGSSNQAFARMSGSALKIAVFGTIPAGPVFNIRVPDLARASEYTATVTEVSDTGNNLRVSLTGYAVRVKR